MKYEEMIQKILNDKFAYGFEKHIKNILTDEIQNNLEVGVEIFDFIYYDMKYHIERSLKWLDNSFDKFEENWTCEKVS